MKPTSESVLQESIERRITNLMSKLGNPFEEEPSLASLAKALDATDKALSGKTQKRPKLEFLARADAFLAAHEIALSLLATRCARGDWEDVTSRASWLFNVESLRRRHVRTLRGLKDLETAFFTEWNEGPWSKTHRFWKAVQDADLPYSRRDLLSEIFERGRITSREHYEFAIDIIGVAEDDGLLDSSGVSRLNRMIAAYEKR